MIDYPRLEHASFAFGTKEEGLRPVVLPSFNCAGQVRFFGLRADLEAVEAYRRAHPEVCKVRAAAYRPDRQGAIAAVHAAKHLRVKCGSFAARRYAEKRGASALMYQIAEEFEQRRGAKCK